MYSCTCFTYTHPYFSGPFGPSSAVYRLVSATPIVRLPPLDGGFYVFVYMFPRTHIHTFRDPAIPPQQFSGILRD